MDEKKKKMSAVRPTTAFIALLQIISACVSLHYLGITLFRSRLFLNVFVGILERRGYETRVVPRLFAPHQYYN